MKKYKVTYQGGEGRYTTAAVDWMMVTIETDDEPIELYAEREIVEGDETATYDDLKADILRQAEENGIDKDSLIFWFDEEGDR